MITQLTNANVAMLQTNVPNTRCKDKDVCVCVCVCAL